MYWRQYPGVHLRHFDLSIETFDAARGLAALPAIANSEEPAQIPTLPFSHKTLMKHFTQYTLLILQSVTVFNHASAQPAFSCCATDDTHTGRPDEHAPISIMGDHTHSKGGFMASYRYMRMDMDDMRQGTDRISSGDVFAENYVVTPESMTMDMHMLGFMYGYSDKLTLTLMSSYIESEMDHSVLPMAAGMINGGSTAFRTRTSGIGDIKVGGLYRFFLKENKKAHVGLSLSLPTGSIDEKDRTPGPGGPATRQLPAAMQLGSGTFDLLPSLTYVQQLESASFGLQTSAIIRLENENSNGYQFGNVFEMTAWGGYNLSNWIGLNMGLNYTYTDDLSGTQENVTRETMSGNRTIPTAFNQNYGGERIDSILGVNFYIPKGYLKNHRLAIDIRLPLWQNLNGEQLETDTSMTIGWQAAF